jgi:hypothetical protein
MSEDDRFSVKVYNHSPSETVFEAKNITCVYLPGEEGLTGPRKISVPPYSWGEFGQFEISRYTFNACIVGASKFNISATKDSRLIGNTTYQVYTTKKRRFFGGMTSPKTTMGIESKDTFPTGWRLDTMVFERKESYGDLFFSGRGLYVENAIKPLVRGSSIGSLEPKEIDELLPTLLINSNQQFVKEVNDNSLITIISRVADLGMQISSVYSFATGKDYGAKSAASALTVAWNELKDKLTEYWDIYQTTVSSCDEISVHVYNGYPTDRQLYSTPAFHLVFTDTTRNAEEIMSGKLYLPEPPNNKNTFYQNIMHLSQEAAQKLKA